MMYEIIVVFSQPDKIGEPELIRPRVLLCFGDCIVDTLILSIKLANGLI